MRVLPYILAGISAAAMAGCADDASQPLAPAPQPAPRVIYAPAEPGDPTSGPVMAFVNGKPVYMAGLHEVLVANYGYKIAQQMVAEELVRQAAQQAGLTANDADVAAEHEDSLAQMFPDVQGLSQRERLLDQLIDKGQISRLQWDMSMRRNALLTKLAQREVEVTEQELRDEFSDEYGRRIVVRHIQLPSLIDAQKALAQIRAGTDFAALASQISINASRAEGGLLPEFGAKTVGVPLALREAALSMNRIGEVSDPVQLMNSFHILKLEKIIEPEGVDFETVKPTLTQAVRERKIQVAKNQILKRLFARAKAQGAIQFVDPTLRSQDEKAQQDFEKENQP